MASGFVGWTRTHLFGSWWSTAVALVLVYFLIRWGIGLFTWAVGNAVWTVPQGANGPDPTACRQLQGAGACWAMIGDKYRFMLFGRYPYLEQWRPALCVA